MSSYYEKILATGEVKCIDEEVPFEIPQGWEWCRLVEVGKTETGTTPSKSHPEYFGDYIPFLGPANILNSKIVSVTQGLSDIGVDYGRIVPKNTILQVCIGGSIGKCAITDKPVTFNQQINSITPYLCNVEFVHIVLQSEYFRLAIMDKATGTATPIINRGNWETLLFPLPPIKEQERIVANITELTHFLGIYSNKQEELNMLNTNMYQRMKKAILQEAIQGKLVPQIAEEGTAQELLEQIKTEKQKLVKNGKLKKSALAVSTIFRGDDNKYYEQIGQSIKCIDDEIPFEIPYNWQWTRLSYISSIYTGNSISEAEKRAKFMGVQGRYYIGTKDVGFDNKIVYDNGISIPLQYEQDFRIAPANSILMCIEGGSAGKKIAVLNQDVCFGNKLCCFSPFMEIEKFIYNYLQSPSFIDLFNQNKTGIIGGVSIAKVKDIVIPLPPLMEQQRIVAQIDDLFEQLR